MNCTRAETLRSFYFKIVYNTETIHYQIIIEIKFLIQLKFLSRLDKLKTVLW